MTDNTARAMAIFVIIALILGGLAVGGVRFIKARNDHYAKQPTQTATTSGQNNPPSSPPAPQQPATNNPPSSSNTPAPTPAPAPAPQPSTPSPTTPTPSTTPTEPGPAAPRNVPATGPASDMALTAVLMMMAAFLGMRLRTIRLSYRRNLQQ